MPVEQEARPSRTGVRVDVQGLRAVAVSLVLVYHLWPSGLTGGFTGVDVFLVISGFLITAHLLSRPPRTAGDLAAFWGRRLRRLLPASLLVLLVTLVASRLVAPETQWETTSRQVRAAALYVVNWLLASDSVDYLASEAAPSPVQHFWSLSVEEQFYAFWPVLLLVLALVARRSGASLRTASALGLGAVVAASLAYSVHETATNPASAYFVTPTRVWELGVGGLLAVAVTLGPRLHPGAAVRAGLAWAGLVAIAVTALTYTSATPFPGWQAALPVLGAAAVIGADAPLGGWSPNRVLALRPVQWLGDVSYSVYLWHWPIIVLLPYASGGSIGVLDAAVVLVVTLVLAALTKRFVEDPFRAGRLRLGLRPTYGLAAAGMAVVVVAVSVQLVEVDRRDAAAAADLQRVMSGDDPCFGAAALARGAAQCPATSDPLVPAPAQAAADKSQAYADVPGGRSCFAAQPQFADVRCTFGDADARTRVALVGNSHAGQWLPALQRLGEAHGWRIDTFLASRCALADVRQALDTPAYSRACRSWVDRTTDAVAAGGFDLVVMTNRISVPATGETFASTAPAFERGYARVLDALDAVPVVTIHDTPFPGSTLDGFVPDCLAAEDERASRCSGPRGTWVRPDPVTRAVEAVDRPDVTTVDLNDLICGRDTCAGAVGGTPVYFDNSHLTATYARTLAPFLDPTLERALAR